MAILLRAAAILTVLGGLAVAESAARAAPSARLVYVRGPGAERCPSEAAVSARLGYDPFPRLGARDDVRRDPAELARLPGAGQAALAAARKHERAFPGGVLVQEREAMVIRALAMLGRHAEAQARADRFHARYPDSVLWPAIVSSLGAPPGQ